MNKKVIQDLKKLKNDKKREILQRFFKTGIGEYGEGDLFLGITVPEIRKVVNQNKDLILKDIEELMKNEYHEIRLCAFLILVQKYETAKKKDSKEVKKIIKFYLKNLKYANNWDIVDLSCYKILGDYLIHNKNDRTILYELIKSKNMWHRRVGIVSNIALIKRGELNEIYNLSQILLIDQEDLMHKAIGWMLREAGKKDETRLKKFLKANIRKIPRTTLRYAIEKFDETERKMYLKM